MNWCGSTMDGACALAVGYGLSAILLLSIVALPIELV
jgi:hypothetical protein